RALVGAVVAASGGTSVGAVVAAWVRAFVGAVVTVALTKSVGRGATVIRCTVATLGARSVMTLGCGATLRTTRTTRPATMARAVRITKTRKNHFIGPPLSWASNDA